MPKSIKILVAELFNLGFMLFPFYCSQHGYTDKFTSDTLLSKQLIQRLGFRLDVIHKIGKMYMVKKIKCTSILFSLKLEGNCQDLMSTETSVLRGSMSMSMLVALFLLLYLTVIIIQRVLNSSLKFLSEGFWFFLP